MKNVENTAYIGTIHLGSPPQYLRTLFDTGSANTWVFSEEAQSQLPMHEAYTKTYFSYNPLESETSGPKTDADDLTFVFGSGWIQGSFTDDLLTLGDPTDEQNQIQIRNFDFGLVEKQDSIFDGCFDAVVGLAYPAMA